MHSELAHSPANVLDACFGVAQVGPLLPSQWTPLVCWNVPTACHLEDYKNRRHR
jgi:hypothetical protein